MVMLGAVQCEDVDLDDPSLVVVDVRDEDREWGLGRGPGAPRGAAGPWSVRFEYRWPRAAAHACVAAARPER